MNGHVGAGFFCLSVEVIAHEEISLADAVRHTAAGTGKPDPFGPEGKVLLLARMESRPSPGAAAGQVRVCAVPGDPAQVPAGKDRPPHQAPGGPA